MNQLINMYPSRTLALAFSVAVGTVLCVWEAILYKHRVPVNPRPKLSLLERWYAASPKRRRVLAVIPGWKLTFEATKRLLVQKQAELLLLRCKIDGDRWVEMNPSALPLERVKDHLENWETVGERLLSENATDRGILWSAVINEKARYLVIMMDHVLTDGLGLANFIRALMDEESITHELPLLLEEQVDVNANSSKLLQALLPKTESRFFSSFADTLESEKTDDKTILLPFRLDGEISRRILQACRAYGTTLHALICACACVTLGSMVGPPETRSLKVLSPISLRSKVRGAEKQPFGNYVAPSSVDVTVSPMTDIWVIAAQFKQELQQQVPMAAKELGLLMFVDDLSDFQSKKEIENPFGRVAAIEVSNLGVCETKMPWIFAQGNHYTGPLLAVNVVTHKTSGEMFFSVTARSLTIVPEKLEHFCNNLQHLLAMVADM